MVIRNPREFDCVECGRHIIQIIGYTEEPELCAACMTMPGWFNYPSLCDLIDPENHRTAVPYDPKGL